MSELQLELETVVDHNEPGFHVLSRSVKEDTHKPAGIRLAKMLGQYEDSPSSQLWADIQRLAREILNASR